MTTPKDGTGPQTARPSGGANAGADSSADERAMAIGVAAAQATGGRAGGLGGILRRRAQDRRIAEGAGAGAGAANSRSRRRGGGLPWLSALLTVFVLVGLLALMVWNSR